MRVHAAAGDAGDGDLQLMMEWRPSRSHGRGGQRTPYLRQTSSGCACRCPGRCRTCPASKYDASGALEHLQLLLLLHLSFARAWCRSPSIASVSADLLPTTARICSRPPTSIPKWPLVFIHVLMPGRGRGWEVSDWLGDDEVIYVGMEELAEDDWWL